MNYKGIPYKTEWVEYPEIENKLKSIGGKPTSKKKDGRDHYTLPVIHDSKTGKVITDSKDIARYLDEIYPDTPLLFPPGTNAAIELQNTLFMDAFKTIFPLMIQESHANLNPASEPYFRSTREDAFGRKMEELCPLGPLREEAWSKFKAALQPLSDAYSANGPGKLLYLGDTFTYADVVVAAFMKWMQVVLSEGEWKEFASWYEGRWGNFLDATAKWQNGD